MPVFEYILILLAAICLSNVLHRFMPVASTPILQIALGALITLLPLGFELVFDPSLFFVLFVAPLIFYVSMMSDKKTMWAQRKPILNMGILLVFVTVVAVGYLLNLLIPSIPLAAAFALIAALGPTDDVAVTSVGKRVNVPPKIMSILQGESIINDASGIVSFQFALAAMLTGSFSLLQATGRFFVVALGGIAVGLLLSWLKYILVHWIRSVGLENVTLHLMLGLLTPFVIFLIAEALNVSGILAIFAAGIAHSFNRDKFNPEKVSLNIASESIWSMLTFTLEGLVFVILGTQLPKILVSINRNTYPITSLQIIAYILLITFLFLLLRFVWSVVAVKKKTYDDPEHPATRFRAGIIFSLSGARGAVTLAGVMSIPFLMSNGEPFPERDLIILIAGGVIVVSLLITSFILPLCVEKTVSIDKSAENDAYLEILQNVIAELQKRITPENESATAIVIANYLSRSADLLRKQNYRNVDREEERKTRITVYEWEKEHIAELLELGETDEKIARHYSGIIDTFIKRLSKNKFAFSKNALRFLFHRKHRRGKKKERIELRTRIFALMEVCTRFVVEKLKDMTLTDDNPVIRKIITDYEFKLSIFQRSLRHKKPDKASPIPVDTRHGLLENDDPTSDDNRRKSWIHTGSPDKDNLASVVATAFQLERDNIMAMLEPGRISRETAKEMRHNISLLEVQLKKEFF